MTLISSTLLDRISSIKVLSQPDAILNDLDEFHDKTTTVENFIKILWTDFKTRLPKHTTIDSIELFETEKNSVIIKPSIVYSVDDKFSTKFMSLLSTLPLMPLYYNGKTKFSPIHVTDLVNIIFNLMSSKEESLVLECIGSEIITFKEIIQILLRSIDKKRILFPIPLPVAKLTAKFFQLFPNPLLTEDQLRLLRYDNCKSENYKNNFDFGYIPEKKFEEEVKKTEVKPEDSPVVETTELTSEDTIPEKDMQAEIDNDLNKKDVEDVKDETSSTLKKITETEAKTEKSPVESNVEQVSNNVPADANTANIESSMNKDTGEMTSPVENVPDSNISKPRIIGASPMPVMHDEAMKALKTLIGDLDKIKFDNSMTTINGQKVLKGRYKVQVGDVLDDIIYSTMGDIPIRHSLLRKAFVETNPHAFIRSNANRLMAGKLIKIPDVNDLRRTIFPGGVVDESSEPVESEKKKPTRKKMDWVRYP